MIFIIYDIHFFKKNYLKNVEEKMKIRLFQHSKSCFFSMDLSYYYYQHFLFMTQIFFTCPRRKKEVKFSVPSISIFCIHRVSKKNNTLRAVIILKSQKRHQQPVRNLNISLNNFYHYFSFITVHLFGCHKPQFLIAQTVGPPWSEVVLSLYTLPIFTTAFWGVSGFIVGKIQ